MRVGRGLPAEPRLTEDGSPYPGQRGWKDGLRIASRGFALLNLATGIVLGATAPIDIGSRRELFVDHFLIEKLTGARLHLHTPRDEGIVLRFDQSWKGPFWGYTTIVRDGERLYAYYRGKPLADRDGSNSEVTCRADFP